MWALWQAGYKPRTMVIATLQALSGAGHPGVASLDIQDNIIPLIKNEEEKTEFEPLKIFGRVENGGDRQRPVDDHLGPLQPRGGRRRAHGLRQPEVRRPLRRRWTKSSASGGSSARRRRSWTCRWRREQPIIYRDEPDRPQPRKDRDADKGMAVTVGRLRKCNVFDIRFVGLHHNTVRGAAGGAILTAELMKARGVI